MNLGRMCEAAARHADRYDEYVKVRGEDGIECFEGEALHWFQLFRDAINEAYFEVSRGRLMPQMRVEYVLPRSREIDMGELVPEVCSVCGVYRADGKSGAEFVFKNRTVIEVRGALAGERVIVDYHYLPERLEREGDEPIFSEAMVDPSVYISLAVARLWQSERKLSAAQMWMSEYYQKLRTVRNSMKPLKLRRLPRNLFR